MNISNLLFQPWIGDHYRQGGKFNIPVMIVGESNYGESQGAELDAMFTHSLINSIIDASWRHLFFSNIQRTFVENANTQESRTEFWHSVAHHEYIQAWLRTAGVPPTEEMWKNAKPIFQEVVSELDPKCILFVCKRVYDRVSADFGEGELITFDGGNRNTLKIHNAYATYVKHPTRYGFRNARKVVRELIRVSGGTTCV
jgi:hypothetical protein